MWERMGGDIEIVRADPGAMDENFRYFRVPDWHAAPASSPQAAENPFSSPSDLPDGINLILKHEVQITTSCEFSSRSSTSTANSTSLSEDCDARWIIL